VSIEIFLAVIVTWAATYLSRLLGMLTSTKIDENSKIYRWFNCLAYSTLAALTSRVLVFPNGDLMDTNYLTRIIVILIATIYSWLIYGHIFKHALDCTTFIGLSISFLYSMVIGFMLIIILSLLI